MCNVLKKFTNRFGHSQKQETTQPEAKPKSSGYIGALETVNGAKQQGLSVSDYVEKIWDQQGATDLVIQHMKEAGSLVPCERVCEIGPGTGRYLERVQKQVHPVQHDIYEVAEDWAAWLAETYAVTWQPTDGHTLKSTPDASCGLVHAHGVFVYLPLLHSFEYFLEMCRVCAPGGFVVFDFYSDKDFDLNTVKHWLSFVDRYPVILPKDTILELFRENQFHLRGEFSNKHGHGFSRYLVFQKDKQVI